MSSIAIDNRGLEKNGRAVFAALRRTSKDFAFVKQAFDFWRSQFASRAEVPVKEYVASLHRHVGLEREQQRTLAVALFAALARDAEQLPVVPDVLMGGSAAKGPTPSRAAADAALVESPRRTDGQVVFQTFLGELVALAHRSRPRVAGELLEMFEESADADSPDQAALLRWLQNGAAGTGMPDTKDPNAMRELVHLVYVCVCEVAGPVAADRILDASIRTASNRPEAVNFSPDQLL